jgi:geranylgeranyl reductase family protein
MGFLNVSILIVGGGPAGSLSAINIGRRGEHEIVIVEEHQSAGFPVQCAGLISDACYSELKKFSKRSLVNRIKGAFFFSPDGGYVELIGRRKGVVVERKILDVELLEKASEYAEVILKSSYLFSKIRESSQNIAKIRTPSGITGIKYDFLIGADGANSRIAKEFSFTKGEIYSAVQFEMKFECLDENMVELYFGEKYSDGFFAYSIPLDSSTARIGVVSKTEPIRFLSNLLNKHPSVKQRKGGSITELNAGAIPIGLNEVVKGNVCLIGDSAGMVKPYTGGGLYYHLVASKVLGKSFPDLEGFKKEYLKVMGKEYTTGEKILRLYKLLSDADYCDLVRLGKEYIETHSEKLDMDHPSTILQFIPSLLKIFVRKPLLVAKITKELL